MADMDPIQQARDSLAGAGWTVTELPGQHWRVDCTRGSRVFYVEGNSRQEALFLACEQAHLIGWTI